jgi:hypothetical protein
MDVITMNDASSNFRDHLTKREVLDACRAWLTGRRAEYAREIAALDEAAAGETKSSAGDKYETAREMLAQSRNILARNLAETEMGLETLGRIERNNPNHARGNGSSQGSIVERAKESTKGSTKDSADRSVKGEPAGFGSLLETDAGSYLLGLGLGEIDLSNGRRIMAISLQSPLGAAFKGKRPGDIVATKRGQITLRRILDDAVEDEARNGDVVKDERG